MRIRLLLSCFCFCMCGVYADDVIWKGKVNSNGSPTELINLELHEHYQIKASQYINLGKWYQVGEKLASDACFEFNDNLTPHKYETLKNNQNISVCDGKYENSHVYLSAPFVAKQNRIFFWVYDTDYEDNNGFLEVEIIHNSK